MRSTDTLHCIAKPHICASWAASAQSGVKTISVFNHKLGMSIPADVDTMRTENLQLKYHKTPDGKSYYYANAEADFSIAIAPVHDGVKEEDMVKHKDDLLKGISEKYKLEENTVKKINGHYLVLVSFYSEVPDGKVFNRRFFAVAGGNLILVTFNYYGTEMEKRKQQIEQSINSVVIK